MSNGQRLLTITLCLEEALIHDDWDAVTNLLNEREKIVAAVQEADSAAPSERDAVTRSEAVLSRCIDRLKEGKKEIVQSLLDGLQGKRMRATYASNQSGSGFRADL